MGVAAGKVGMAEINRILKPGQKRLRSYHVRCRCRQIPHPPTRGFEAAQWMPARCLVRHYFAAGAGQSGGRQPGSKVQSCQGPRRLPYLAPAQMTARTTSFAGRSIRASSPMVDGDCEGSSALSSQLLLDKRHPCYKRIISGRAQLPISSLTPGLSA